MQLVIDIDEIIYKEAVNNRLLFDKYISEVAIAIIDGTPLPKGHGRLIDENELIDEIVCEEIDGIYHDVIYAHSVYDANTVIEADKENE